MSVVVSPHVVMEISRVKAIGLKDDDRPRLAAVIRAAGDRPDFAPLQRDFPGSRHHGTGGSDFARAIASSEFHQEMESI